MFSQGSVRHQAETRATAAASSTVRTEPPLHLISRLFSFLRMPVPQTNSSLSTHKHNNTKKDSVEESVAKKRLRFFGNAFFFQENYTALPVCQWGKRVNEKSPRDVLKSARIPQKRNIDFRTVASQRQLLKAFTSLGCFNPFDAVCVAE